MRSTPPAPPGYRVTLMPGQRALTAATAASVTLVSRNESAVSDVRPESARARAASRDIQGTGLGLEIVGRIVRLHEGDVRFANRADGGFRVTVRLPLLP